MEEWKSGIMVFYKDISDLIFLQKNAIRVFNPYLITQHSTVSVFQLPNSTEAHQLTFNHLG